MNKSTSNQIAFLKAIMLGLCLFGCISIKSQDYDDQKKLANLEKKLESTPQDERASILNTLASGYLPVNAEKSLEYAEKALDLSKMIKDDQEKAKAFILIGKAHISLLQYEEARNICQTALDSLKISGNDTLVSDLMFLLGEVYYRLNDHKKAVDNLSGSVIIEEKQNRLHQLAERYSFLGMFFSSTNDYTSSLYYYNKAIDIEESLRNKPSIADLYNSSGILYADLGNYEKALKNYLKSLRIVEDLNDKQKMAMVLNNIGIVYADWGNKEKALEYYQKSLNIEEELGNKRGFGDSYNNIGIIYSDWNQNELAIEYYTLALKIYQEFNDSIGLAKALNNIGESLLAQSNHEKALEYLNQSLEIEKRIGNKYGISESYHAIANAYYETDDYKKAEENNLLSFKIADSLKLNSILLLNFDLFYKIYSSKKNYKQALEYFIKYSSQKDSIYSRKFHDNLAELQVKHEIDRMDKEKEEADNNYKNSIKENRTQRIYLIIIFILMLIFGYLVYFDIKSKITANKKLKKINDELTSQKEEISKTLDELGKSESKYRNLVENSPTGIVYLDKKGNILEINKKMLEILGSPSEEATKEINCLKFPPLQQVGLSEAILKSVETHNMIFNETQYTTKWGKTIEIRYYVTPVLNQRGNVSSLILNVEDVSTYKKFERSKIQSEKKYRILVENSLQAMLIIRKGQLIFANARLEELSQYKFNELAGEKDWLQIIIHPEDYSRVSANINDALKNKKIPARNEYKYVRKDGVVRWMESLGSIVEFDGHPAILVVAIDITERKEAEKILVESEKQLRRANAMKDKFFSIIAHDLKNPFNAILGFSNLLFEAYDNFDDKQRKLYIKNICEASGNTFKLLQNLLEWSRIQSGKIEVVPQKIDISEMVDENFIVLKPAAQSKKIELTSSITKPLTAYADSNMVKAIIRNLISNAIKFTHPGGKIDVSAISAGSEVTVTIADTGIGIKPSDLKRLFRIDDHFRTNGTQNEEGSGLGLILCKEFVEKNGGKIWAESKKGSGSKFIFTLPSEAK